MSSSISTQIAAEPAVRVEQIDPLAHLGELREVHRSALGVLTASDDWARRALPQHTTRDDFVFLAARARESIAAFVYGYTGTFGQWWTERVARAFTPELRAQWLEPPHYEVVELHVRPAWQRRGIGSALLEQLLSRQPHDRALLSTKAGSRQARDFYAKNGWTELAPVDFGNGYAPYLVLGKFLREEHLRFSSRGPSLP